MIGPDGRGRLSSGDSNIGRRIPFLALVIVLCFLGFWFARSRMRARATATATRDASRLHSLPSYHGAYVALWTGLPSFFLVLFWLFLQGAVIDSLLLTVDHSVPLARGIAIVGVFFATLNVVGGFLVTHRMLEMFKKK